MKKILDKFGIHESWHEIFKDWFSFKEGNLNVVFNELKKLEANNITFCPGKENIFKVFRMPRSFIRVIWVLQDPYPNPNLANGIAMSVPKGEDSPTIEAVRNELFNYTHDIRIDEKFDETLEHWESQGIFLLNSALTCRAFAPKSHNEMWQPFIRHVLSELNKESGRIYIFSGKVAQNFSHCVTGNNYVINTYHPAADKHKSYSDKKYFEGNGLFKQIDEIIEMINGKEFKINWLKE